MAAQTPSGTYSIGIPVATGDAVTAAVVTGLVSNYSSGAFLQDANITVRVAEHDYDPAGGHPHVTPFHHDENWRVNRGREPALLLPPRCIRAQCAATEVRTHNCPAACSVLRSRTATGITR